MGRRQDLLDHVASHPPASEDDLGPRSGHSGPSHSGPPVRWGKPTRAPGSPGGTLGREQGLYSWDAWGAEARLEPLPRASQGGASVGHAHDGVLTSPEARRKPAAPGCRATPGVGWGKPGPGCSARGKVGSRLGDRCPPPGSTSAPLSSAPQTGLDRAGQARLLEGPQDALHVSRAAFLRVCWPGPRDAGRPGQGRRARERRRGRSRAGPLPPAAGGQRADGRGPSTLRDSTPAVHTRGARRRVGSSRASGSPRPSPSSRLLASSSWERPVCPKGAWLPAGWTLGTGTAAAASPSEEPLLSYENAFRFAFQEVPVEQAPEDVCPLDRFLEISCEENPSLAPMPRLCSESRKLWRALQNPDTVPSSPCLWSESRCRENLFPILGIDPAQKSLSGGQSHILEGSDLREPEELLAVSSFHLHHCKALIPTKLSGTPGNTQGSLITYSLFLKTPPHGNGHCITIPRKKIFMPRSLKMAFFNNGVG